MNSVAEKLAGKMLELVVSDLVLDPKLQARATVDEATAEKYMALLEAGVKLPPIRVALIEAKYFPTDGWHRVSAAKRASLSTISAQVIATTWDEAYEDALGANHAHGLPRSNADIKRVVTIALERWPTRSDRALAKICRVSDRTVNRARARATLSHGKSNKAKIRHFRNTKKPAGPLSTAVAAETTVLSPSTEATGQPPPGPPVQVPVVVVDPAAQNEAMPLHPAVVCVRNYVAQSIRQHPDMAPAFEQVLRELLVTVHALLNGRHLPGN